MVPYWFLLVWSKLEISKEWDLFQPLTLDSPGEKPTTVAAAAAVFAVVFIAAVAFRTSGVTKEQQRKKNSRSECETLFSRDWESLKDEDEAWNGLNRTKQKMSWKYLQEKKLKGGQVKDLLKDHGVMVKTLPRHASDLGLILCHPTTCFFLISLG